jgi:tetraacyldisaccharide 4'-kinase
MRSLLTQLLLRAWYGRSVFVRLLRPISSLYALLLAQRRAMFAMGWRKVEQPAVCVIVVGNVVAGGAGKTPTVLSVVQHLSTRGWAVGIISKGYGRKENTTIEVSVDAPVDGVGDEALLLRQRSGLPVFVGPSRRRSLQALLGAYPQTRVVVCDDGLQDYSLYRDVEICMMHEEGLGNGYLLPAGPLREPWPRKALACSGVDDAHLLIVSSGRALAGQFATRRRLGVIARRADGKSCPISSLRADPALKALAGIARPAQFFAMLQEAGLTLAAHEALPDHANFRAYTRASLGPYTLLCTEKDAAKLWAIAPDAWAVPLEQSLDESFYAALEARIAVAWAGRLSLPHGH